MSTRLRIEVLRDLSTRGRRGGWDADGGILMDFGPLPDLADRWRVEEEWL